MTKFNTTPGTYMHYKSQNYEVIGIAIHTETMEEMVVYKSLYDTPEYPIGTIWVRPAEMFFGNVIVDGKEVTRFTKID